MSELRADDKDTDEEREQARDEAIKASGIITEILNCLPIPLYFWQTNSQTKVGITSILLCPTVKKLKIRLLAHNSPIAVNLKTYFRYHRGALYTGSGKALR